MYRLDYHSLNVYLFLQCHDVFTSEAQVYTILAHSWIDQVPQRAQTSSRGPLSVVPVAVERADLLLGDAANLRRLAGFFRGSSQQVKTGVRVVRGVSTVKQP